MVNPDSVVLRDGRKPSVLIVEDEPMIRLALSDYLQDCGFIVMTASNAADARVTIEAKASDIDVVLTDVRMPGDMDGYGLARWIRQHRPSLPVLITTGDEAMADMASELCEKSPIISKPHDFKLVLARIRGAINASNGSPG